MQLRVPEKREDVTLDWLNSIFKKHGVTVHDFKFTGEASNGRGYMGTLEQVELEISRPLNNNSISLTGGSIADDKEDGCREVLHVIFKTLPDDPFRKSLAAQGGFSSREVSMYTEVFAEWQKFLDSRQVPMSNRFRHPICYYGTEQGNEDTYKYVLVLENLIVPSSLSLNFQLWNGGYSDPLPWLQTSAVIRQIARFHATGIAYQIENQVESHNQVFPKLNHSTDAMVGFQVMWDTGFETAKQVIRETMEKEEIPEGIFEQLDYLKGDENQELLLQWFTDPSVVQGVKTVCHNDLHSNNLVLSEENSMAILFDYQACCTFNPMKDLSFFMVLNCHSEDSINNLPRALQLYHDEFAATMAAMKIDFRYELDDMKKDYDKFLAFSLTHIMTGAPIWITGENSTFKTKRSYSQVVVDTYKRGLLNYPKVEEQFDK